MSVAGRPIRPDEVAEVKAKQHIPPEVFDCFNAAIATHWNGRESTFSQREVVDAIVVKMRSAQPAISRDPPETFIQRIEAMHWLDIEPCYEQYGWKVEYDKPGYNETGSAMFTFRKNRKRG